MNGANLKDGQEELEELKVSFVNIDNREQVMETDSVSFTITFSASSAKRISPHL
jgi:hypothetical protein